MNAFAKLVEELEKKDAKNRLNSWHELLLTHIREANAMQREPEVNWEIVREKRQKAVFFWNTLYGAIEILGEMGTVDYSTAHAAEIQLDAEMMKEA